MKKWTVSRLLPPLWGVAVFGAALVILERELRHYHFQDIRQSLDVLAPSTLLLAASVTVLNFLILGGYDRLALRYIGRRLPCTRTALVSFMSYAFGNSMGAFLMSDTAVRYRFYSGWGLSAEEITKIALFCALSLWLGILSLGGLLFFLAPPPETAVLHLPVFALRLVGLTLTLLPLAYLLLNATSRGRRFLLGGWEFKLPGLMLAIGQIVVAVLDWMTAALVLYMLLPPAGLPSFPHFLAVVLAAHATGLVSQIPGGVGVFEAAVLLLLGPAVPSHDISAALIAYRIIYYLMPLAAAAVVFAISELRQRASVRRVGELVSAWTSVLAPSLLAFTTFLAGAMLLFSGATPAEHGRLAWLRDFLPLPVLEVSHFVGSLIGLGLVLLARGLARRLDAAYHLTAVLLTVGIAASLLKGLDYEEALALGVMLILLALSHRHFYRTASLTQERFTPPWIVAITLVMASSVWLGFFVYKHVEYTGELWWQFAFSADASRFLRASVGVVGLALAVAIFRLLRPAGSAPALPTAAEFDRCRGVVESSGETYAYLALLGDKSLLFSASGHTFIMYGVAGRSWVAMGDPVGQEAEMPELLWRFRGLADRYGGQTVFLQVSSKRLAMYLDLGLTFIKLGEEALVPLDRFTLEGSQHKGLRHARNRMQREGMSFEVIPPVGVPPLLSELKPLSDAWLEAKQTREKRFSLGWFDEKYLVMTPVAVVRQEGHVVAFANLWPGAGREELSIDLMRHRPDGPSGIMDYLFVELMLWAQSEGYRWFNLGLAPLSGLEDRPLAPLWNRLAALAFRHGELVYDFKGLRQYKEKFAPVWEPKYLASPGGLSLPRILADVAALASGGYAGIVVR